MAQALSESELRNLVYEPDARGHFGPYGGRYVSETLMAALAELDRSYQSLKNDPAFQQEFDADLSSFVGRPSPLYHAKRWSDAIGGAQIYFKREDLNHTGAHKVNNTIGQALLAKYSGKPRVIAETGAGQHGVATATVTARLGLECVVYMGADDVERQSPNVYRMKLLGATVVPVTSGSRTLKDALSEAMRDWVTNVESTFYIIGTVAGPAPYPQIVRDFNAVVGREVRWQSQDLFGRFPDALVACVGGGSNALGLFYPFLNDTEVALIGAGAAGRGSSTTAHAAPLSDGHPGILNGGKTYIMDNADGQISHTHSVSAGLDYPGVGPEHAFLKDIGRAQYVGATDDEALSAFHEVSEVEGIIPALETAHALAYTKTLAASMRPDQVVVCNMSGRGDKDIFTVAKLEGITL